MLSTIYFLHFRIKPQETIFFTGGKKRADYEEKDLGTLWVVPDDIWLRIFSYLSLQERVQVSFVCKKWNGLCKDSFFWRTVDFAFCNSFKSITDDTVRAVASYSSGIQSIDLSGDHCEPITDVAVSHVGRFCPQLQKLNLAGRCNISNRGLRLVARSCPRLRELNVDKCKRIGDKGIKFVSGRCSELEVLSVACCHKITDKGMHTVAQKCTHLKVLNVAGCKNISDKTLVFLGQNCSTLQNINLKDIETISLYGIESLVGGTPSLTHVHLGVIRDVQNTMAALQIIVKYCQSLQFLSFQHFYKAGVGVQGGVRKVQKKKLGAFVNSLNACVVLQHNR